MNCPICKTSLTRLKAKVEACISLHDDETIEIDITCDTCNAVLDGYVDITEFVLRESSI